MDRIVRTVLALTTIAVLCILAAPPAQATSITFRLDRAFVVGDQVYPGGVITLRSVGRSELLALVVNGEQVVLFQREDLGTRTPEAVPYAVFQRGDDGMLHFACVRFGSPDGLSDQVIGLRIATLSPGLRSVPHAVLDPQYIALR